MFSRRNSKQVKVGNLPIGGGSEITVQSMLSVRADDIEGNIIQAKRLESAGCDIIRVAVPDLKSVVLIDKLKESVKCPIVADVHFDYRIAVESAYAGADKIRINPGNIGDKSRIKAVVDACRQKKIPIRIGVNAGSIEKEILASYGEVTAKGLCESAKKNINLLESFDFEDIVVSIKASDVKLMTESYHMLAGLCSYPLHLGVTEAGTEHMGIIKSSIGIGSLLIAGIGDTVRVSLTADPVKEVYAAKDILRAVGLLQDRVTVVSCPTCGRTKINIVKLANDVETALKDIDKPIKVAVMGCVVNGPGEARQADIGVAGGDGAGVIFKKGEIIHRVDNEAEILPLLLKEIEKM